MKLYNVAVSWTFRPDISYYRLFEIQQAGITNL